MRSIQSAPIIEIALSLALIGLLAALIIPALAPSSTVGGTQPPASQTGGVFIGLLLVVYGIAKRRHLTRPWVWAIVGACLPFFVQGYLLARGKGQQLEGDFFGSIERFDPSAAEQLRGLKDDQPALAKALQPVLARAIQRAPDQALLALASAQERLITPKSADDLSRCVAAARGTGASAAGISAEDQAAVIRAESDLFRAAASNAEVPVALDEEAVQTLLAPIYREVYAQIVPGGELDDPAKLAKLSDHDSCEMYLNVSRRIHALPIADAALVVRYMASGNAK